MKRQLIALAMIFVPAFAQAANYQGAQLIEAKAVLQNPEIAALLAVEKKAHKLTCEKATLDDVTIQADAAMDDFEMIVQCNDVNGGANVQRVHFSGGVYTAALDSKTASVVVTGMLIEISE